MHIASRRLGHSDSYLQQFMSRGSPVELHERDRIKLAEMLGINPDDIRGPSDPIPARTYAKANNNNHARHSGVIKEDAARSNMSPTGQNFVDYKVPFPTMGERDLPVFGTAQGGDGALIITDRPVDWESRPDVLARVQDAYAMIITGDSMDPACKHGSTALVNPHLPQRNGDMCIFRAHADDGSVRAVVKDLVRFNDTTWYVRQYNPRKDYTLKRSEWQICHVVVGVNFRR